MCVYFAHTFFKVFFQSEEKILVRCHGNSHLPTSAVLSRPRLRKVSARNRTCAGDAVVAKVTVDQQDGSDVGKQAVAFKNPSAPVFGVPLPLPLSLSGRGRVGLSAPTLICFVSAWQGSINTALVSHARTHKHTSTSACKRAVAGGDTECRTEAAK